MKQIKMVGLDNRRGKSRSDRVTCCEGQHRAMVGIVNKWPMSGIGYTRTCQPCLHHDRNAPKSGHSRAAARATEPDPKRSNRLSRRFVRFPVTKQTCENTATAGQAVD